MPTSPNIDRDQTLRLNIKQKYVDCLSVIILQAALSPVWA